MSAFQCILNSNVIRNVQQYQFCQIQIFKNMILNTNKTHSVASPGQSFYFCLVPKKINYIGSEQLFLTRDAFFKFALFKGQQKFSETKNRIKAIFDEYGRVLIEDSPQLVFLIPNYVPSRKFIFYLKLYFFDKDMSQNVGQLTIDGNRLIRAYKQEKSNYIPETSELSTNYQLQYEIFIENSRTDLDKIVTDARNLAKIDTISQSRSQPEKQPLYSPLPMRKKNKFSIISEKDAELEQSKIKSKQYNPDQQYQNSPRKSSPQKSSLIRLEKVQTKTIRQQNQAFEFDFQKTKKKSRHGKKSQYFHDKDSLQQQSIRLPDSTRRKALVKHQKGQMNTSRSMNEALAQQQRILQKTQKTGQDDALRSHLKLIIFIFLSLFLIYNAMLPTKKYNSKKRR